MLLNNDGLIYYEMSCFVNFFEIYDALIINHWVAPAIAIKFGLSWSLLSFFELTGVLGFPFSYYVIVTYDVKCEFESCDL